MKSWIHEIAESYVSGHKPVRRDLKENYVQLNEEQKFGLLSENVLNYLDEQLQNAYGFGIGDLSEEELNTIFANLLEYIGPAARALQMATHNVDGRQKPVRRTRRATPAGFALPNTEAAKKRERDLERADKLGDALPDSDRRKKETYGKVTDAIQDDEELIRNLDIRNLRR